MAMNIKSEEAYIMAQKISKITGDSLTKTVLLALQQRYERLEKKRDKDVIIKQALAISELCASRLTDKTKYIDHGDMLYDDKGLPL